MCGHPRRVHAQDGACNICWCFQFESSVVENPGTPYPTRAVAKAVPVPLEEPRTMADVPGGFSMPKGDQ
jgi:hypothetical protein